MKKYKITSQCSLDIMAGLRYIEKWNNEFPLEEREKIAKQTNAINDKGCSYFEFGDIDSAIDYFNQALQIMPINSDALKNLAICYTKKLQLGKVFEQISKLYNYYPLFTSIRNQVIAASVLLLLIDDFDEYGGYVVPNNLISFFNEHFAFMYVNISSIEEAIIKINDSLKKQLIFKDFDSYLRTDIYHITSDTVNISLLQKVLINILLWK
jgi:tetratricopeptide (TPR) repeat protein